MAPKPPKDVDEYTFGDARDAIIQRAKAANIKYEVDQNSLRGEPPERALTLTMPNGRNFRDIHITSLEAVQFASANFESWTFLGEWGAILDRRAGTVEALIQSQSNTRFLDRRLRSLPGVEYVDASPSPHLDETGGFSSGDQEAKTWRLRLGSPGAKLYVEISHSTPAFAAVISRAEAGRSFLSLKIGGVATDRHDEALETLVNYSNSLFLELDIRFNLAVSLVRLSRLSFSVRLVKSLPEAQVAPIAMPRNKYTAEAVSLYFYGRSATGMPLLQFLAYYQTIEYYFPSFWNSKMISKLRRDLRDPRFDVEDDAQLNRLISLIDSSTAGRASEREQLRATLEACVEEVDIRDFLAASTAREDSLAKKDAIRNVTLVRVNSNARLVDQVADRVYDIRCRIVHSKENGGPVGVSPLLPFSVEADRLSVDIELIKMLAQKVIITGSRGRLE